MTFSYNFLISALTLICSLACAQGNSSNDHTSAYIFQDNEASITNLVSENPLLTVANPTENGIYTTTLNAVHNHISESLSPPSKAIDSTEKNVPLTSYALSAEDRYVKATSQEWIYYLNAGGKTFYA